MTPGAPGTPDDEVLRAEGLGWWSAWALLLRLVRPFRGRVGLAFALGVLRVVAFIGIGVLSALVVAGIKLGTPVDGLLIALYAIAPLAGLLHWLESWVAHDMAFRLLTDMRIALYDKLDRLAPAYLLRRRTGDIVGMATQDVELVEYFYAHTVAPALVAVLVPAAVMATLVIYGWPTAVALAPFIALVGLSPFLLRKRLDRLGGRAREMLGLLNAHAVDTIQGLTELLAFRQESARRRVFLGFVRDHHRVRMPYYRDLTFQMALIETATGLGGLAVVMGGAAWVGAGQLEAAWLPLLAILAMATFLPVSEIAHVGRQLADTLGATRRLHAVHSAPVTVTDGPGALPEPGAPALAMEGWASPMWARSGRRSTPSRSRCAPARRWPLWVPRAPARPPAPTSSCASGTRPRAPCASTAWTCGSGSSTTCAPASRWWRRTPTSSTTRSAPTS